MPIIQNLLLPDTNLVSIEWLNANIENPLIQIIESKLKPIGANDSWETGFKIPGAVLMDIEEDFSDKSSDLPHTLPSEAHFTHATKKIGLKDNRVFVVYDQVGIYAAPRAWWMLKTMGCQNVYVLDGGIREWMKASFPVQRASFEFNNVGDFVAKLDKAWLKSLDNVTATIEQGTAKILDARSQARFDGDAPEPRAGLRGGHMPGAQCLPFQEVISSSGKMKTVEELKEIFYDKLNPADEVIFTCGSGVTASIICFAAHLAGFKKLSVYDGSWSEWGRGEKNSVVKRVE